MAGVVTLGLGLGLSLFTAPNKHLLTPAYLLITVGAAALALSVLEVVIHLVKDHDIPILGALGRNPLLAYMAGGVLTLVIRSFLPPGLELSLAWAASLATLAVMILVSLFLDRKGMHLRL